MGFENDCILNIQSLAGEYFCAFCRTLVYPNEAIQAPCTHLYCKPCLSYVVSTTQACPYDGYRVTEADSKPLLESNKALADTIGKIQVHCLFYRTGCTWQGPLSDCTSHCSICTFGESAVLCNRCGVQLKHRQVHEHVQSCSGAQPVQQPGAVQDTPAGASAAPNQTQTPVQAGGSASLVQASQAPTLPVSSQDANQTANSATQPQVAQAATPTPEQLYQQQQQQYQQQYQQYYQQYPGYDPYQQNYQQYYQYPQAAQAQQYQQQPQAYAQAYGQAQAQAQAQTQPVVQAQQPVQLQVPPQGAQPLMHPHSQPAVNAQPQAASVGQAVQVQPQMQSQVQVQPQAQPPPPHAHPYNQGQPYAQHQPVAQQQLPVSQYPQTHPQMLHPHAQPYPQSQTQQHYPHSQPQPPQQAVPPTTQLQTPNAATGYQSFPQAQAQYPSQIQGQFPPQNAQMRPPQPFPNAPNQQQPAMVPTQGQPPSGPVYPQAQQPVYSQAQQPGYPYHQRPGVPAAQQGASQQYPQQPPFPGQGPFMQHQSAQMHAQGPQMTPQLQQNHGQPPSAHPNVAQNYAGRPMGVQTVAHPHAQAAGVTGGNAQVRPPQFNQNHPMKTNSQLLNNEQQATQSQRAPSGEKIHDPASNKGVHGQTDPSKEARDVAMASNARTSADNHVHEAKSGTNGDHGEGLSETSGDVGKSGSADPGNVLKKAEVQESKQMAKDGSDGSVPPSLPKTHFKSQAHGPNSTDHGRNQLQPISQSSAHPVNSQKPGFLGHPSNQLRPQGPGQAPSNAFPQNPPGGVHGPGSSGSLGIPSNVSHQGNFPPHQASFNGPRPDASRYEIERFAAHRAGHLDGRKPDSHLHAKFGGPSVHDSMLAPGMRDERGIPFADDHLKRFPPRDFEDDFRKFPGPPHLEAGPSSNNRMRFPSSGPLDRGPHMFGDGMLRSFDKEPHGFDRDPLFKMGGVASGPSRLLPPFHPKDVGERRHAFPDDDMRRAEFRRPDLFGPSPGPGFEHHRMDGLPPRSPGRDFPGLPSRMFGPYGDDPRSFEGSKPFNFPGEPFRKPLHESRFPVPPPDDFDIPGKLRRGGHLGFRNLPSRDPSIFGRPGELSQMEPHLSGNFPPHIPFGDTFGGEKTGLPGFPRHAHDGGFHPRELEPFDNLRKRKPGSVMCLICKVECGSVEGLDLHSQSREHQKQAIDMVLNIKQQNNKKQKMSKDRAFLEERRDGGRPKNLGFQGRGNKR